MKNFLDNINTYYISLLILIIIIFKSAFKNGKPTCNNYVINTYLYTLFMLLFFVTCIKKLNELNFNIDDHGLMYMVIVIFSIFGLIIFSNIISKDNFIGKHIAWLLIILILAILSNHTYKYISKDDLDKILIKLCLIVCGLTIVAFLYPDLINMKLLPYLLLGLFVIIISLIVDSIFFKTPKTNKILNYGILFIFSYLLLIDTKSIKLNQKSCVNADYINQSSNLFLDIINIMNSLINVSNNITN